MFPELFERNYLSYEEAQKDSISFRLGAAKFINELEDAQRWFEGLAKSLKNYGEYYERMEKLILGYNEGLVALAKKISAKRFPGLIGWAVTNYRTRSNGNTL